VTEDGVGGLEESRFRRGLRRTHRGALYAATLGGIGAAIFLILLIARNTRQVKLDYVFGSSSTALIWLILLSATAGWVLGIATSFFVRRGRREQR